MKPMVFIVFGMLSLAVVGNVSADIVRCKTADGRVFFSNIGTQCESGAAQRHAAEIVPERERENAQQRALQDQRAVASKTAKSAIRESDAGAASDASGGQSERVNACLMGVTAKTGLSPRAEASGRASCFQGTKGRVRECERAVSSTMRLSSVDEQSLLATCQRFQ